MSAGASDMISKILLAVIQSPHDGVMVPIPQYPLYSALLVLDNAKFVPYNLTESQGWDINVQDLQTQLLFAKQSQINIKAFTLINPGNPTGQIVSYQTLKDIVKFCYDNQILILADEVYQENIYLENKQFCSLRKVILESEFPYNKTQAVSFNSCSKGFLGECGFRGGYAEFLNFDKEVLEQFRKMKNIYKGANNIGQILTDLMINPPSLENGYSEQTVQQYQHERDEIMSSLKEKANLVTDSLNKMKNISCQVSEGAMYAFPRIYLSQSAILAAKSQGYQPDQFYCLQALEKLGLVLVPGSGFKQEQNTFHFRITILIRPTQRLQESLEKFQHFNEWFHQQYP